MVTVRKYTKSYLSPQDVSEALELVIKICGCLWNKSRKKRAVLSLKNPYDIVCVFASR